MSSIMTNPQKTDGPVSIPRVCETQILIESQIDTLFNSIMGLRDRLTPYCSENDKPLPQPQEVQREASCNFEIDQFRILGMINASQASIDGLHRDLNI